MYSLIFKAIVLGIVLISSVKCDDAAAGATTTSGTTPPIAPPPVGVPPGGGGGLPGGLGGLGGLAGLFPGLGGGGLGFNKHLDINAGLGGGFAPFLGGLGLGGLGGGLGGGIPPPGVEPGLGGGAGFGPFGLIGPSYIPSTWIGSALGAKGDLLFPLVIFIFFIVGLWTVVQFLLALIVPLIASKLAILRSVTNSVRSRRATTPQEDKAEQVEHLTNEVWAAFENYGCMKTSACYTGNMIHSMAGKDNVKLYEGFLDTMKIVDKEVVGIFKKACESGKEDCSQYPCDAFGHAEKKVNPGGEEHQNNVS